MSLYSVTEVLGPWSDFSGIPEAVLNHAAERGTRVHGACSALVRGLYVPPLPEDCRGYVDSFMDWTQYLEPGAKTEVELTDEALGFIGHVDLICRIKGDRLHAIIDLKTPATKTPTWRLQLAAYKHLAEKAGYEIGRIGTLRLSKTGGRAILDEYDPTGADFAAFISALNVYRFFNPEPKRRNP